MNIFSACKKAGVIIFLCTTASVSFAVDTHVWEQSDQADFSRGTRKGLSIRSDGRVTLAPRFQELDSTSVPYLWSLALNSKGNLFYAGGAPTGATTKIYSLAKGSKPKVFAELTGLEVHALAIDKQDRLYAAVLPDAKIYRIDGSGKPQLFFDPKCKYVWTMAFDGAGNLFLATGENGLIYKVTPDGKGSEFYDTQETHARSLAIDSEGNLIVGTEPGGLVLRVSPTGQGFVLFQSDKREVTAVTEKDGAIYASVIGSKSGGLGVTGPPPVLPASPAPVAPTGATRAATQRPAAAPSVGTLNATVGGGSSVYRIQRDGFAERIWTSSTDLVYALAFDRAGRLLLGTGNKGVIYRVDSDHLSTELLAAPPTQVTDFLQGADGTVYAATGNVGNVYAISPDLEGSGTLTSDVLDASEFAYWGKVHTTPVIDKSFLQVETRSGNRNNPLNGWSPWTPVELRATGGPIHSPPARFLQYRLTLKAEADGHSPELSAIDLPFLPKNIAPDIPQIELGPLNYRQAASPSALERSTAASGSPLTLTLPAVGTKRQASSGLSLESAGGATLQYNKGFETVRWSANDPNGDAMTFKVEIRSASGRDWQTLKDNLQDRFYAFDTAAFPDGRYVVRITASDAPGNIASAALTRSLESDPFTIDNTAPVLSEATNSSSGAQSVLKFTATDTLSWLDKAEYSLDGSEWIRIQPDDRVTDSQKLSYTIKGKTAAAVSVRVFDEDDNVSVKQYVFR